MSDRDAWTYGINAGTNRSDAVRRLEILGRAGFTVSVCAGPSGDQPFRWSVLVGFPNGESFERPYAADSFAHAVWIAEHEIEKRGWMMRSHE